MFENDEKLIEGYLNGNQREFFEISGWINTVVKNEYWGLNNDWADIIQDIRIKLYINLKQKRFHYSASLKTYVCRIAKYTCIDYLRKKYRTKEINAESIDIEDNKNNFMSVIQKEHKQILRQILLELTEKCRKTLQLVFVEKLSYKKISSELNIAEGTVKSRVSRCIEKAIQLRKKNWE